MADSWADGMRRDAYRQWAEARRGEVERGKPWTAWDYLTNPGNTLNRGFTELQADLYDASHMNEDPDQKRAELLRKARMSPNDLNAQSTWGMLLRKGLLEGR